MAEPESVFNATMTDGAVIRLRRYGKQHGRRILGSHGNGFAIDAYWPFWQSFLDHYELVLFDLRSHGQNPRHELAHHHLDVMASDLCHIRSVVDAEFGAKPVAGIFHSVSGIACVLAHARFGLEWESLVLVDPPFLPSPNHVLRDEAYAAEMKLSAWAETRPGLFAQPEELADVLQRSRSARNWQDGAHARLANAVLREAHEGFELSCPGPYEAQIYADNASMDLTPHLHNMTGPLMLICADPAMEGAWMPARINADLAPTHAHTYTTVAGTGHMLQLEEPEEAAQQIARFFADHNFTD